MPCRTTTAAPSSAAARSAKGLVQHQIPYADGSALAPYGGTLLYPDGPHDTETLCQRRRVRLRDGHRAPLPQQRVLLGRQHPLRRLAAFRHAQGARSYTEAEASCPDIFIPMDTTDITPYYMEVSGRNILYRFTLDYADRHREALNAVRTIPELTGAARRRQDALRRLRALCRRAGVAPWRATHSPLAQDHGGTAARLYRRSTPLDSDGFYYNIFPIDNVVSRTIEWRGASASGEAPAIPSREAPPRQQRNRKPSKGSGEEGSLLRNIKKGVNSDKEREL